MSMIPATSSGRSGVPEPEHVADLVQRDRLEIEVTGLAAARHRPRERAVEEDVGLDDAAVFRVDEERGRPEHAILLRAVLETEDVHAILEPGQGLCEADELAADVGAFDAGPRAERPLDRRLELLRAHARGAAIGDEIPDREFAPRQRHRSGADAAPELQVARQRRGSGEDQDERDEQREAAAHRASPAAAIARATRSANASSGTDVRSGAPRRSVTGCGPCAISAGGTTRRRPDGSTRTR
jgi:hypothetical protein